MNPESTLTETPCPACDRPTTVRREGVCLPCWYSSPDRPKPVRDRWVKLQRLHEEGFEPYAYSFDRSHELAEARDAFEKAAAEEAEKLAPVRVAGRRSCCGAASRLDSGTSPPLTYRITSPTNWASRSMMHWRWRNKHGFEIIGADPRSDWR